MSRTVVPPLSELDALRQPLTEGERRVLDWFLEVLPSRWEIYIQPHLNGLRPDFVLLNPDCGIAVYEVKDWSLCGMDYFARNGRLMARKDGKTFSLGARDPVSAIDQYKREIYGLYAPSLPAEKGLGAVVAGIIFTNAGTQEANDLLAPLRDDRKHSEHPRLYPVIGSELIGDCSKAALRKLLSAAERIDDRMNSRVAAELRHWLVEPSFAAEQRVPLTKIMTKKQKELCLKEDRRPFLRIKGPAGSGKSLVLAGRAAELATRGRRVLLVTFNITLINYLLDIAVQYTQSGAVRQQITALNFHYWCRRVAFMADKSDEYGELWKGRDDDEQVADSVLETGMALKAAAWAAAMDEDDRWDAVLVDEGQDFQPEWWTALRAALTTRGDGEGMFVADRQQNIYGVKPWTESRMSDAGFSGPWHKLENSYRMSPALCRLATDFVDRFQPEADEHRPLAPQGEFEFKSVLRWRQVPPEGVVDACIDALLGILSASQDDPVAVADLVCIVEREDIGLGITRKLREKNIRTIHTFGQGEGEREKGEDSRRKKLAFYKGDARIKVTTIQSFKGWESKALVVHISDADNPRDLALAYAGITRLKRDDRGCYLTVVCSAPQLREYGETWPKGA